MAIGDEHEDGKIGGLILVVMMMIMIVMMMIMMMMMMIMIMIAGGAVDPWSCFVIVFTGQLSAPKDVI